MKLSPKENWGLTVILKVWEEIVEGLK